MKYFEDALVLVEAHPQCADDVAVLGLLADMTLLLILLFLPGRLSRLVEQHRARVDRVGAVQAKVIVLTNYAFATTLMCQYRSALPAAEEAIEMALRLDDARSKAYARGAIMLVKATIGLADIDETQRHVELGIHEGDQTDDPYAQVWFRGNVAWSCLYRGLTDRGRVVALELQEHGRTRGDPRAAATGLWILGQLDIIDERYDDALVHSNECIELALTPLDVEAGFLTKGIAEIMRGNVREGAALLRDHRQKAVANDFHYYRLSCDPVLGVAMVLEG